jgi:DNA transformation protein and related proteins
LSSAEDPDYLTELFAAFGPVKFRRMFGGAGLFVEGLMIGLVSDGVIYLRADEQTAPAFEREDLKPFSYDTKTGTHTLASYWRMPERLYDDPDELARWATQALEAAQRTAQRKSSVHSPRTKAKTGAKRASKK